MLNSAVRSISLVVLTGCATAIPDSMRVATDTGGLSAPDGLCGDRTAGIGTAPFERVELDIECAAPGEDGLLKSCSEVALAMRDSMGGIIHLEGLLELQVSVDLPARAQGRATVTVVPLDEAATLQDGTIPVLRFEVPVDASSRSLQVFPEDKPKSCKKDEACALMALDAFLEQGAQTQKQYPLGTAASGVFMLDGIGWDEDPIVLGLEVPFFAPESDEATVCSDGLIHYARSR